MKKLKRFIRTSWVKHEKKGKNEKREREIEMDGVSEVKCEDF